VSFAQTSESSAIKPKNAARRLIASVSHEDRNVQLAFKVIEKPHCIRLQKILIEVFLELVLILFANRDIGFSKNNPASFDGCDLVEINNK
jgi:hypothetical protein